VAAGGFDCRGFPVRRLVRWGTGRVGREEVGAWKQRGDEGPAFDCTPERAAAGRHTEGAAIAHELGKQFFPLRLLPANHEGEQQIVELVEVFGRGPGFVTHPLDRLRIEQGPRPRVDRQPARDADRPGPPFLERRIVEKGVRPAVQNLVAQRRWFGAVAEVQAHCAPFHGFEQQLEPPDIHRLVQTVVERLPHQRMLGNFDRTGGIFLALGQRRKDRGHDVVRLHPLDRRRVLLAVPHPQDDERSVQIPAPPGREHR
jgi:hypothetical protein